MKIMYLSPLGIPKYDDFFAEMLSSIKNKKTEVHVTSLNASVGKFEHLENRTYQGLVYSDIIRAVQQASIEGFDAFIIGCFYDTALLDAREISGDMIVVGPCHSSIELALTLSHEFSILLGKDNWIQQISSVIREYGYAHKIKSFRTINMGVCDFQKNRDTTCEQLIEAGIKAIEIDKAQALVLGCTLESGFHQKISDRLNVPVIDPVLAAFKNAEYLADLKNAHGFKPSRKWSLEGPDRNELTKHGVFDRGYQFGNRVVIK